MSHAVRTAVLALCAAAVWLVASHAAAEDLARMMRLSADQWVGSQGRDGFFVYEFSFLDGTARETDKMSRANLIRQTYAGFVLARYYLHSRDESLREPVRRALAAYHGRSVPIGRSTTQAVLEETRLLSLPFARFKLRQGLERLGLLYDTSGKGLIPASDATYANATPGAVAFALLTELTYAQASGDQSFAPWRAAWLEGLLALRLPGRGFRQDAASIDADDYYSNGEAWLALATYVALHPDDAHAQRALRAVDDALIERYTTSPHRGIYSWGVMAAAQRFKTTRDPRFATFIRTQSRLFLDRYRTPILPEENTCAAMEGVIAALQVLPGASGKDDDVRPGLERWLEAERAKLLAFQIQPGQDGMALGGDGYLRAPRMAGFAGAFIQGRYDPVVRVDLAAHCVSAMLLLDGERWH